MNKQQWQADQKRLAEVYAQNNGFGRDRLARAAGVHESTAQRFLKKMKAQVPLPSEDKKTAHDSINIVSFHDVHIPYHDPSAVKAVQAFCAHTQPDILVFHEVHDFYELSDFDKNPARVHTIQDELDCAFEEMRKLRKACPHSRMIMLESNHTDRLRRFLWRKASALSSLRALDIAGLMRLQEIEVEYKENFTYRNFMFKHGDVVRKDAAYTAKAELEREGVSGSSGHTHRLGKHYRTLRGGAYCWIEGGCLCDLKPEYVKGIPNWQHGMVHVSFEKSGSQFYAQDIPIINGKILYGGEIIKA